MASYDSIKPIARERLGMHEGLGLHAATALAAGFLRSRFFSCREL